MNNILIKSVMNKISLKDLYDEVKNDELMIYNLGLIFVKKKKTFFTDMIRNLIKDAIKDNNDELLEFFKKELIEMEPVEGVKGRLSIRGNYEGC